MKLRIAWGGGAERIWHGAMGLSAGSFRELKPLGIEADEPGSIWLDGTQIQIRQPSARAYDGVDLSVTADLDARMTIWLSNDQAETAKTLQIALRDLIGQQPYHTALDDAGNRLFVSRSPGDRLRIDFERDHLVFEPGESFSFQVRPFLVETSTAGLRLQAKITTNPGDQRVWSEEYATGDEGTATSITIRVPQTEGVYDLSIAAAQPSRIKKRLGLQKPVAERKIQLVVLEPQASALAGEPPTSRVVEINPVNPRWWERFANLPLFGGFPKGPLGNGHAAPWEHPSLGSLIQLGPGGAAPEISWEAYPLPIKYSGQVHVLEIEYPSDVPQAMGISLLEPNAAGAVMPIGLDSGVYVSDEEAAGPPQLAKHKVVFWPRTKTPLLLITNRRPGSPAVYGKITVLSAASSQFSMLTLGRTDSASSLPPAFADEKRPERLWAGYLDRPLVPENFGAPEALDRQSFRSLDDWNTFHQGGIRLVRYLKHVGFGGLMLSVYADGSTIYPSRILEPTPRYDTGVFFATGQDPRRKDALELFFRLFDREGLVLIPALQFAAPLPELEALKRAGGPDAAGIEWIGPDGKPWLASGAPRQGLAPYYNLLDPRVQQAMLNAALEVVARYANHDSFGGLALQLSPDGYAQLPGQAWGYDDPTVARFQRETTIQVPGGGSQRFAHRAKFLEGPGREAWLTWRAAVVARFHRRLEREIAARHPGAKLYLAGGTLLEDRQTLYQLRPTLPRRTKLDLAIKELGIQVQSYRADQGIVMLRPQLLRPSAAPLPAPALETEIYLSAEMDRLFAGMTERGSLFYHEPQKARLANFDVDSPFGAAKTYTWLVSQMSPAGDRNRRRFVHSLAISDACEVFDGGWLLPLGQEGALSELINVFRQLPAGKFETLAGEFQPVTIRTLTRDGQTYVYLVNDSPWNVGAAIELEAPPDCRLEKIGTSPGVGPLVRSGTLATWDVSLRPYDLVAARLSAPNVRVRNPLVSVPVEVRQALERRIADLVARVAASGNPQPLGVIENTGFELPPAGDEIAGWTIGAAMGGRVALDSRFKHSGDQSILLSSSGQSVSIASVPFDPPTTGRLAVEVQLRAADPRNPPALKIAVEGEMREGVFNNPHGIIERVGEKARVSGDWVPYSFPIIDVPSEGLSNLRVRFELLGAGEVWIDDVQVFGLWFDDVERLELGKIVSLASLHLEKRQFADCTRLLEGYWPQFLVANVAISPANTPLAQRRQPTAPPREPPKKPGMLENLRNYFR
ncbi:MAG: family 10 glycosylhydrolase [Pirellulales bacterium]